MALTYTNHKGIKAAKPPESGHKEYKDTNTTGLYLRVYSTGLKVFVHRYKIKGKRLVFTLPCIVLNQRSSESDISLALMEARAIHAKQRLDIKAGNDPAIERDLKAHHIQTMPTLTEFADTYIERHAKPNKKSWKEDRRMLDVDILPVLGDMPLNKIERKHLISLLDKKQDLGVLTLRNHLIALLNKLFNFAVDDRSIIGVNPMQGIKKIAIKARSRVLNDDEIQMFWERTSETGGLAPCTRLALRLVLVTGQRPGEVCQMRHSQIYGDLWKMPETKNGRAHIVPLTPMALGIIQEASLHSRNGIVFPNSKDGVMLVNVLDRSMSRHNWGTDDKPTPHDLRRTCLTGLGALGVSRFVQNLVANHVDNSIGAIYDQYAYGKEKRQALEAWAQRLTQIIVCETTSENLSYIPTNR